MTGRPLAVLVVEDSQDDTDLLARQLRAGGLDVSTERVDNADAMREALARRQWDLVVSDHRMPRFDAISALALLRARDPDVPFVIVSGSIGEDLAVAAMKAGANDYITKQALARLAPAVQRELREAEGRRARRRAELERELCSERERVARANAAFLAEASKLLATSLERNEVLAAVAHLAVPWLGDWCALCAPDDDGGPPASVVVHVDPALADVATEYGCAHWDMIMREGAAEAARAGRARLVARVDDAWLAAACGEPAQIALARRLGIDRAIIVPLMGRGRTVGAMMLAAKGDGPGYTEADIEVAEDLARRAGAAVDNAELYRAAQRAVRTREEFLAVASHELRTPLTSLRVSVQMLQRTMRAGHHDAASDARVVRLLDSINRDSGRLDKLASSLLDVSRIGSGTLDLAPEEADLADLARDAIARVQDAAGAAQAPRIHLHVRGDVTGRWDPLRLGQVFENLISNALRFGRGQPVEVTIGSHGAVAMVSVRDRGIGIAPEHIARIFGRFERAVPEGHYGGLGLGLYVTRAIVEASGGDVHVSSELNVGSVFTVVLPRRRSAAPAVPLPAPRH